jgi:hypothetical protein
MVMRQSLLGYLDLLRLLVMKRLRLLEFVDLVLEMAESGKL